MGTRYLVISEYLRQLAFLTASLCSEKPEKSFLREPIVATHSRLAMYLDGGLRLPGPSWMQDRSGRKIEGTEEGME